MTPLTFLQGVTNEYGWAARRRPPYFRTKKLALLGNTPSLAFTPWHDGTWTLAAHPCCRPKCQREPDWYFDLHRPECFRTGKHWNRDYHGWLKRLQTPIFMQEAWPEIPMAVRYPLELVDASFATSVTGQLFATNHCAYLIALAMLEGVEQIGLFGCQYAGGERGTQRESLIYWIARFEQYGGRVVVPRKHNSIMVRRLYGYDSHDEHGKLIPEYRPTTVVVTQKGETRKLAIVGQDDLPPLMQLPNDECPALDRRQRFYGAQLPQSHHAAHADTRALVAAGC